MLWPYGIDHLAGVFAQAGTGGAEVPWLQVLNYGALGLIVLLLITNRLALPREVKDAKEALEAERRAHAQTRTDLQDERRAHNETRAVVFAALTDDVVPALTRSTAALETLAKGG